MGARENVASSMRINDESSPSSHIIGAPVSFAWSCHVQLGVSTRSPGSIGSFSASTTV